MSDHEEDIWDKTWACETLGLFLYCQAQIRYLLNRPHAPGWAWISAYWPACWHNCNSYLTPLPVFHISRAQLRDAVLHWPATLTELMDQSVVFCIKFKPTVGTCRPEGLLQPAFDHN